MTTKKAAAVEKAERMAPEVAERAAAVPTFGHVTFHPDRYSSKGARKASGHGAGARRRQAAPDE